MKSITMKKLMIFALCLTVFTVLCAVTSFADDYGNFTYSKSEDESYITITNVNIDEDEPQCIEIPAYIDDIPVTTIGNDAFKGKENIGDVVFPETLTTIGSAAFANCDGLKTVILGSEVKEIGTSAFYECSALETVYITDSVETIGDIAFKDCTALKNVHFGTGLTYIGKGAFFGCTQLKTVVLSTEPVLGDHALGSYQNGDIVASTGLVINKQSVEADGEWVNIRVATDTYTGIDMRVSSVCGDIELRDNTEIPVVNNESTLISVIIILVLCAVFAVVCVIYIKKEKARRNKAIEEYKNNNK